MRRTTIGRPPSGPETSWATTGLPTCAACRGSGGCASTIDLILFCHGSPGSLTDGLPADLDPTVTIDRVSRTDASLIVCGHTHLPEVREVGWRTIVNDGSAGYVFDGDPTASWALIDIDGEEVKAEIKRTTYDVMAAANAVAERGLPGDVYRAATIRTGKLVR